MLHKSGAQKPTSAALEPTNVALVTAMLHKNGAPEPTNAALALSREGMCRNPSSTSPLYTSILILSALDS